MAEEEKQEKGGDGEVEATESKSKGKGKLMQIGAGLAVLVVMAWIAATFAVPGKEKHPRFSTPSTIPMVLDPDTKMPITLDENNKKHYM
ncbi:MAG: hypothetical protein KDC14_10645, partial [Planctomycetes bacterium]|nr:hypothetical protein [Planctomycetota bacterium]